MGSIKISCPSKTSLQGTVQLNGSKSISNRVLIMQALSDKAMRIRNLSNAEDTRTLLRLLENENDSILDAGDAGTTFRFLTAYLACRPRKHFLTGTKRMLERPIGVLVEALRYLGANIQYAGREGYPPLQIGSPNFQAESMPVLHVQSGISSQYISALLMIAPTLSKGLTLQLEGKTVSEPYIDMTLSLMGTFGIEYIKSGNNITIEPQEYKATDFEVESDWSAASYYYALAALCKGSAEITLKTLYQDSTQGDACIAQVMKSFGIETAFNEGGAVTLRKSETILPTFFEYDFTNCPDLAQTVATVLAGLGVPGKLTGLQTLVIKETDRIAALKTELEKLGASIKTTDSSLEIEKGIDTNVDNKTIPALTTYKDHRMAMAFAPLSLCLGTLKFDSRDVVAKSYPAFWDDLGKLGFSVK